jgi:hypothetical protein
VPHPLLFLCALVLVPAITDAALAFKGGLRLGSVGSHSVSPRWVSQRQHSVGPRSVTQSVHTQSTLGRSTGRSTCRNTARSLGTCGPLSRCDAMTVPDGSSTYTRKGFLRSTTNFPPRSRQCSADLWTPPPPPVQHAGTVVHPATHSCHEHCCCWSWRSWWPTGQRYRPPPPPPTRPESPMSDMPLQDPRAPLDIPRLTLPASQHSLRPITVPIP